MVNHVRARLGLPDFIGTWEFARDALYLSMCLDLLTSDATALSERHERELVNSIDENISNIKGYISIDPTVAPLNAPSKDVEELMEDDQPMALKIVISMVVGATTLAILLPLPALYLASGRAGQRTQEDSGEDEGPGVYSA